MEMKDVIRPMSKNGLKRFNIWRNARQNTVKHPNKRRIVSE
ncbi:hypothetical protein V1387_03130 [Allomuricauda taeanensis]|nr:hypothetical protein [Allomuricauda taeanensis]